MTFYLEIRHKRNLASQNDSAARVIGPFKSFRRLNSFEIATDLGPLVANEKILFYDRSCFESWEILTEKSERECEPYDPKKAILQEFTSQDKDPRTTIEKLHEIVDRKLLAYSEYFGKPLTAQDIC
jgi:hypothetical protein